jgi:hypothetical protein
LKRRRADAILSGKKSGNFRTGSFRHKQMAQRMAWNPPFNKPYRR